MKKKQKIVKWEIRMQAGEAEAQGTFWLYKTFEILVKHKNIMHHLHIQLAIPSFHKL